MASETTPCKHQSGSARSSYGRWDTLNTAKSPGKLWYMLDNKMHKEWETDINGACLEPALQSQGAKYRARTVNISPFSTAHTRARQHWELIVDSTGLPALAYGISMYCTVEKYDRLLIVY